MRCVVIMINAKRHGFAKRWATISCMRQISLHVGWGCIPVRRRFAPVLCVVIQDAFTKSKASRNAEQCLTLMSLSAKPLLLYQKWHSFSRFVHNLFKKFRRLFQKIILKMRKIIPQYFYPFPPKALLGKKSKP